MTSSSEASLDKTHELGILKDIRDAVHGFEARANYACGGRIPVNYGVRNVGDIGASKGPITCPPISLRWDSAQGGIKKIQFPPTEDTRLQHANNLSELIANCAPASFGRGGIDVHDETYRKAGKLDDTQFATEFTPYNCGIISAVTQTLLPGFAVPKLPGRNTALEHIGVVVELYKLNHHLACSRLMLILHVVQRSLGLWSSVCHANTRVGMILKSSSGSESLRASRNFQNQNICSSLMFPGFCTYMPDTI